MRVTIFEAPFELIDRTGVPLTFTTEPRLKRLCFSDVVSIAGANSRTLPNVSKGNVLIMKESIRALLFSFVIDVRVLARAKLSCRSAFRDWNVGARMLYVPPGFGRVMEELFYKTDTVGLEAMAFLSEWLRFFFLFMFAGVHLL